MPIDILYEFLDEKNLVAFAQTPQAVAYFTSKVSPWIWQDAHICHPADHVWKMQIFPKKKLKTKLREWARHGLTAQPYDKIEAGDEEDETA